MSGPQEDGEVESRNADLGENLRPQSERAAPDLLGTDPRSQAIERNLGLGR